VASVVLNQDGSVLGMYGGDWGSSEVNLARRPGPGGSVDKPWVYAFAEQSGFIQNLGQTFTEEVPFNWPNANIDGSSYDVDAGAHLPNGTGTGYDALALSSNMIPLHLLRDNPGAVEGTAQLMEDFGIHSDTPPLPSEALGWREASLFDRTVGMNGLVANQGKSVTARSVNSVTVLRGNEFTQIDNGAFTPAEPRQVLPPAIAADITEGLRGPAARGTAADSLGSLAAQTDIAGKTGSAPNGAAAYFIGTAATGMGDVTVGVIMRRVEDLNNMGPDSNGGGYPAQVFGAIVSPMVDGSRRIN
jgi:membrane peptidoglycan carboxypeptidase